MLISARVRRREGNSANPDDASSIDYKVPLIVFFVSVVLFAVYAATYYVMTKKKNWIAAAMVLVMVVLLSMNVMRKGGGLGLTAFGAFACGYVLKVSPKLNQEAFNIVKQAKFKVCSVLAAAVAIVASLVGCWFVCFAAIIPDAAYDISTFVYFAWATSFVYYFAILSISQIVITRWRENERYLEEDTRRADDRYDDGSERTPCCHGCSSCAEAQITCKYHLGSVCCASVFMVFAELIRSAKKLCKKNKPFEKWDDERDPSSQHYKKASCCTRVREYLRFTSQDALVYMAMEGEDLRIAGWKALTVGAIPFSLSRVMCIIVGKAALTLGSYSVVDFVKQNDSDWFPSIVFATVMGFMLATLFFAVAEATLDTVLLLRGKERGLKQKVKGFMDKTKKAFRFKKNKVTPGKQTAAGAGFIMYYY